MYHVEFPKFGWEFDLSPTVFKIGNFELRWYGLIIACGFLLAFIYALYSAKKMRINQDKLINCVIFGLIGGIVGARLYYVIFYSGSTYRDNPLAIFNIFEGGLGIYGGIIGALLVGGITAKICKMKVSAVLDVASLGFLIGQCIGRWGNFVNQEAFGTATDLPWGMTSEATQKFTSSPVHPCFLYESLWCLLGFILLHFFTRKLRRYDGQTFLLYLIWYGVGRFFIEGLRTDSLLTPFINLRVSQLVAAVTVLAAVVLLIVFHKKTSLTGCGSKKVMAMNQLVDEIPAEDGPSTIFGDLPPVDAEEDPQEENAASASEDSHAVPDSGEPEGEESGAAEAAVAVVEAPERSMEDIEEPSSDENK